MLTGSELGARMLYIGLKGKDVYELKNRLIKKGYYVRTTNATMTDVFDEETRNAVGKLQQANQLVQDYIVDSKVVAYLTDEAKPTLPKSLLGNRLLQWGVSGADVIELKTKLIQKGYLNGESSQVVTDRFDDATEKAVKWLQQANGIAATGQVTDAVIRLLL